MYKFSDKEEAKEKIHELEEKGLTIFYFEADKKYFGSIWRKSARKKIKECDCVCFYFNRYSYINDGTQKSIIWEYKTAQKYGKKVIFIDGSKDNESIKIIEDEEKKLLKKLFNESYDEKTLDIKLSNFDKTKEKLNSEINWDARNVVVQSSPISEGLGKSDYYMILFEQYKLMVETSESLINRRQTTSNVYIGILTALISLVGSSLALNNKIVTGVIFFAVGIITFVLSRNWKSMLIHLGKNNEGKFAVINAIEEKLPANMFDTEYTYNKIKSIVSYASREITLCKTFTTGGVIISVLGVILFIVGLLNR